MSEQLEDATNAAPVVGIGASAGGLAAVEEFFRGLPPEPGMAFVVVQHLSPDHESELANLLQNHTPLSVAQAEDGVRVEVDRVYVIPPGRQLTLEDGVLRLHAARGKSGHVEAPIDIFFRSLAADLGEASTCVILSGTGSDGTVGLKAIKEAGGITLVQSPEDAEYDGMPRSAAGTGLADITGPARELAARLIEFRASAARNSLPDQPDQLPGDGSAALVRIFTLLRERTGHDFSHYKRTSILRRVNRRLNLLGLSELDSYLAHIRQNPDELDALFRDFLISVTNFFRDREAWEQLENEVVPRLFNGKSAEDTIRVWVPGCATGEEAYSLAILLCEHASSLEHPPQIQIFATDIDDDALAFAREAIYPDAVATDISTERVKRFFERRPDGLRVKKVIREMVLLAPHNLLRDAPFSRQDLISCRNLLIYLSREVQESVFELFHYSLRSDGCLFLGSSESAEGAERLFSPIDKRHRVYARRPAPSHPPSFPKVLTSDGRPPRAFTRERDRQGRSIAERHQEHLARTRVPPIILVDADYQICHIAGGAHRFLREVDGVPTYDLLDKILPELRLDLRAALFQALSNRTAVRTATIPTHLDGESRGVWMEVAPLDERTFQAPFVEVLFCVVDEPLERETVSPVEGKDQVATRLEEELNRTRERLQTIIEEYETANEELKASNEELQSMNEELRSTTEELETGREELQSMNEEMVTVNHELRSKVQELARSNSDLSNLMAATDIGTIFLDRDLRIKRYTPRAEDLFHLQSTDVGRPLRALTQRLHPHDLVQLAAEVLRDLAPIEREQQLDDGRWFSTRIRPYRTVDDAIEGVVLSFVDITDIRDASQKAAFQAKVLAQVSDAVIAVGLDERVVYLNAAAAERLEIDPDAALGRTLPQSVEIRYPPGTTRREAIDAVGRVGEWRGEIEYVTRSGRRIIVEARLTPLESEDGSRIGTLGVLRDVTARRAVEKLAHERQQYLRTALRNVPIVASISDTELRYTWIYNPHPDFDPDTVVGKRDDELLGPEAAREIMQLKRDVLHHERSMRRELRFERSDGSRAYDMTVDPLYDEAGQLVGVTTAGLDVTDRMRHEEELRRAKKAAEAANESKSAFLAAMSHELRTPLNAITGYVDLMELGVPDDLTPAQSDHVGRIKVSARHLRQLIEEILQFARLEAGHETAEWNDVALSELFDEIVAIMEPTAANKELSLTISSDGAPSKIRSDPRKLRQVLLNLLGNAIKFTNSGRIELRVERADGRIEFNVIDTGVGMTDEEIANIFEPFWQSDNSLTRKSEGTGLGLTISKRYVDLLGGELRVLSARGSGSVFTVSLPHDA